MLAIIQQEESHPEGIKTLAIFGTPHGIVELIDSGSLRDTTKDERKMLREFESLAEKAKKEMYGGEVAIQEILKKHQTTVVKS